MKEIKRKVIGMLFLITGLVGVITGIIVAAGHVLCLPFLNLPIVPDASVGLVLGGFITSFIGLGIFTNWDRKNNTGKNKTGKNEDVETKKELPKRVLLTILLKDYNKIEKLVKEGKYKSRNVFVQIAVKRLIEEEIGSTPMDDETINLLKKALHIT